MESAENIESETYLYAHKNNFLEFVSLPNLSLDTSNSHIMGHFGTECCK